MSLVHKPRVLVSSPFYLPGYRAGGALRTIVNLVSQLGDRIDFKIVTGDRDSLMDRPYSGVILETWLRRENAKVYYVDKNKLSFAYWKSLLNHQDYDVLYLNSLLSFEFSIKPAILARLRLLRTPHILLAPRGELSMGALGIKARRKKMFLAFAKLFSLYKHVVFQASSQYERADIIRVFGERVRIVIAADIPASKPAAGKIEIDKKDNCARFLFLGRIGPVKNLKGALLTLLKCKHQCKFQIFGPVSDDLYWKECEDIIAHMPEGVTVEYLGEVDNCRIDEVFLSNHYLLLPTLGENFGHVIYESLSRGTPVLISDQTPWRNLQEKQIGWDIPLEDAEAWGGAISHCINMTARQYETMSERCVEYARTFSQSNGLLNQNFNLLASFGSPPDIT